MTEHQPTSGCAGHPPGDDMLKDFAGLDGLLRVKGCTCTNPATHDGVKP